MRIIAGTHRGRPLIGPKDEKTTRPITDRVKETLFNRLHSLGVLGDGRAVDVFCGTGSMGLEALSRGAAHCTFVDRDRDAIDRLRRNLDALKLTDHATVVPGGALPALWALRLPDQSVTVAFVDPPYAMARVDVNSNADSEAPHVNAGSDADENPAPHSHAGLPAALRPLFVALLPKLEPGGVLVYRTDADTTAGEVAGYDGPARKTYGGMALHFYQRPMEDDDTTIDDQ